jgi:uncharacterized membrane protein YagU involved in acid resistance
MKRILIFVLLGPPIAAAAVIAQTAVGIWWFKISQPSRDVPALIYGIVIVFYIFGFVPAFLTSLIDLVLARIMLGRGLRVGLTAFAGAVIIAGLPLLAPMLGHLPFSWSELFGAGLLGALPAAVCSYLCLRNETRKIMADEPAGSVPV